MAVAKHFRELLRQLADIRSDIRALGTMPGAECVAINAIEIEFKNLHHSITAGLYSKKCSECQGMGCKSCQDRGWQPKGVYVVPQAIPGRVQGVDSERATEQEEYSCRNANGDWEDGDCPLDD